MSLSPNIGFHIVPLETCCPVKGLFRSLVKAVPIKFSLDHLSVQFHFGGLVLCHGGKGIGVRHVPSTDNDMDMGLWALLLHPCCHQLPVLFVRDQSCLLCDPLFKLFDIPYGFSSLHFPYLVPEPCYFPSVRCILLNLFVKSPKSALMLNLGIIFQVLCLYLLIPMETLGLVLHKLPCVFP